MRCFVRGGRGEEEEGGREGRKGGTLRTCRLTPLPSLLWGLGNWASSPHSPREEHSNGQDSGVLTVVNIGILSSPHGDEHLHALDPSSAVHMAQEDVPLHLGKCLGSKTAVWDEDYVYFHLDSVC